MAARLALLSFSLASLVVPSFAEAADSGRPLIVAHRGLLLHAPENTLANFRACLELRLGFEFDVARTKDGELVCIHDATVDRTTDGTGRVADLTLEAMRRLDAGSWFDPAFAGEKVPSVDEVLKLLAEYRRHGVLVAVDLKAEDVERDVVRLAREHRVLDRLLFIGRTISEPAVRERLKSESREARTAAVANDAGEFPAALAAPNADWVYVRFLPSREQVEAVHRGGKRCFIAGPTVTGDEPENWRQAAVVGLDAILTDHPLRVRTLLAKNARE
jgi:glycerophosphoryl diester phosphodiesterase